MKLALYGSIGWRHPFGIRQVIEWAKEQDWDMVDARGLSLDIIADIKQRLTAFGYDMLGPKQIRASARKQLRQTCEEHSIPLLGIYCSSPVNLPGELGKQGRSLFREYLQLGADVGATWIRSINNTTADGVGGHMSPQEAYDRTVEGSKDVGTLAGDLGIQLLLENNENTATPDAKSLLSLKQDIGNVCDVGIAYDPVNAYFQGLDVEQGFDLLAGQIDILHLKNVRREKEPRWDYMPRGDYSYEWKPLDEGDLHWPTLLKKAKDGGFNGPLVYEYVNPFKGMPLEYWDTLPEPEEAAAREGRYLRGIIEQL